MASTTTERPSSSSTSHSPWSRDVFLSFRGEDTRRSFTDHLYSALIRNNIRTFRDDEELPRGGEIKPELLKAIEESRIAIIVFSKTYAHSKWCLEELVKIMKCKEEREQMVIPIFYHVDPSDVRNQTGICGEAFTHHEENADEGKKEKIRKWKTAMREVGNLAGYDVKNRYESKVIDEIIEKIHGSLPKILDVNENIVGMDFRVEKLISLLKIELGDVRMVGVYGLGGIGKTTIISALYNKISYQFKSISLLTNVREESTKDSGLLQLQQQLLDDTLGTKGQIILRNIHEGVKVIRDKLSLKKVLVLLDDVDKLKQLEHLIGKHNWFGPGSRIVITTRKKYVLTQHGVDDMYEVDKLNFDEALQLFCCYAFKQHLPKEGYRDLSHQVVRYADGLPLALKILGPVFFGKGLLDWKHELDKLENVPNMEIVNMLKISYEGLDYTQQMIFLDIACFFKGGDMQRLLRIWNGSRFDAESGINALLERCLITISNNTICMHDLLAQMGKEIVYQECPNEPGERSRLWRHMDIYRVLKRNMGTEKIEGLVLDTYKSEQIVFTSKAFRRMNRLRLLEVSHNHVQLSEDFAFPSADLTYLYWDGYSLESLPSNFHANNLVELHLSNSNIKLLWKGNMYLRNLRRINLNGSQQLVELPNFSNVPNLEELFLSGCVSLESLPGDIHQLKHLLTLHCNGCSKLTSFPKIKRNIGKLVELSLDETAIKELPSSIELLEGLHNLYLNNCKNLESLPNSICNLRFLEVLSLDGCSKLDRLPEGLERMPCLEILSLNSLSCRLPSLSGLSLLRRLHLDQCMLAPGVIKSDNCLHALKELSLRNCNLNERGAFNQIFHLSSLEVLNLSGCNPEEGGILSDILVGISHLSNLRALDLSHCKKLSQIPELPSSLRLLDVHSSIGTSLPPMHSLVNCLKSANQDLKHKSSSNEVFLADSDYIGQGICIIVPGSSGIPEWIRNQREGSHIRIKLPQNWYENNDFLGIVICFVYVPLDECEDIPENDFAHALENESGDGDLNESDDGALNESDDLLEAESSISTELVCQLIIDGKYGFSPQFVQCLSFGTTCKCYHDVVSEQMWVILYPKIAIQESCHSNQFTSLEASFLVSCNNFKVLKCGLQPMYTQDPMVQTEDVDVSCLECQRNVEYRKLCLKGQTINQLPTECAFDTLCLRECKNLESLPTSIWELKSLKSLFCSNCSQLQRFPKILENMENLRELHLNGTAIKELPSSIEYLNRLEVLNLESCQNLVTVPESICNLCFLEVLIVSFCSKLQKLPQNLGRLQSLKILYAHGLNSMCCQSLSLSGLCTLKSLFLSWSKIMQGVILSDIFCLCSLEVLDLRFCITDGGIPCEIFHLSSLQELLLTGNHFRSIPTRINQLSMLRVLDLSHCPELRQIPVLPSSLRVLDVHECTWLETSSGLLWSSLFNCFKSVIQDLECGIYIREKRFSRVSLIISGSSGIPKWIRHYKKGAKVVAKLPQNWYKNSDLLGFVLYSIYDPLDNKSEGRLENGETYFKYDLTLHGHEFQLVDELSFYFSQSCYDVVPKMWMIYYPKLAINKKYHSNKWRQLTASFCGYLHGKAMKVEECGIHLIYAHDHDQNHGKAMIPTICWECQQDMQSRRKLCLKGNAINELPTIGCPLELDSLCLWDCKNLEHLPSSICELKSLTTLFCSGCSQLRSFPEMLEDMENLRELDLKGTAVEELPASIQHLRGLQYLNLNDCTNLVSLPKSICYLKSLTTLSCSGCINLRVFPEIWENMENLRELHLNETAIEELQSSIQHLRELQRLNLQDCNNLVSLPESICNLKSLTTLSLFGCSNLRVFPEISENMENLRELHLDGTAIEELPSSIQHLRRLQYLTLTNCTNLVSLSESICNLKFLTTLSCSSCTNLRVFPEIWENMENLRELYLNETAIEELPSSIQNLRGLQILNLEDCNNLVSLPKSICNLKSLTALSLFGCSNLRVFPEISENMENLRELHLDGTAIEKLPSSIQHLRRLQYLTLTNCANLVSLSESICNLKFLTILSLSDCSNLRVLPKILKKMKNLRELYLNGTAIEELPSSIEHLQGLQCLNLACCTNLVSLPECICNLKSLTSLSCYGCSNLRVFPEILENMENLRDLYLNGTSIKELPSSIEHLQGLQCLDLKNCSNLVNIPESICKLSSLKRLSVNFCAKLEKFPKNLGSLQCLEQLGAAGFDSNLVLGALYSDACYMSSWEALNLSMNCFSNIPAGINQLSKLRVLNLSHCHRLLQVPELPPSLRALDVHGCTCLETLSTPSSLLGFSLLKCFKSAIEEFKCGSYRDKFIRIVTPGNNGIPEWINQKKSGSQITIELPMDWYKNNNFLGFALYSTFVPMACPKLNCELNFCGDGSESWHVDNVRFVFCQICGKSNQMCVAYYPKVAIVNQYWSNKWISLKASFHSFDGKPVEVMECGFHLIYTSNVINRNIPADTCTNARRSWENTEATKHNHQPMIEYNDGQRNCDTGSAAEDTNSNAQTFYDCIQCNEQSDAVDAQDDEEDHVHNWLELLRKFVQWIFCRRL